MKAKRLYLAAWLAMVFLVGSCGSTSSPTDAGGAPPNNGGATQPAVAGRTMADDLVAKFPSCPRDSGEWLAPEDVLAEAAEWVHVVEVTVAGKDDGGDPPPMSKVVADDGTTAELLVHDSYWRGIEWGLANDAEVWFAVADPEATYIPGTVAYVLVLLPDGSVYMAGECGDEKVRRALREELGPATDARLRGLIGLTKKDEILASLRGRPEPPTLDDDEIVVLNPETADAELLNSLQQAVIHIQVPTPAGGEFTICTKARVGWNDCIMADDSARDGQVVSGYVGDDGVLEVWLLNENADLSRPVRKLGEVVVPSEMRSLPVVALDLEVNAGSNNGSARLRGAVKVDDLEGSGWPGIERMQDGATSEPVVEGEE